MKTRPFWMRCVQLEQLFNVNAYESSVHTIEWKCTKRIKSLGDGSVSATCGTGKSISSSCSNCCFQCTVSSSTAIVRTAYSHSLINCLCSGKITIFAKKHYKTITFSFNCWYASVWDIKSRASLQSIRSRASFRPRTLKFLVATWRFYIDWIKQVSRLLYWATWKQRDLSNCFNVSLRLENFVQEKLLHSSV